MPFNTALSGLRAASTSLEVTGNNIANSATTGFKESRAEFADVYAASFFSGGNNIGSGVVVENISQQFSLGAISFTENALDLAINGNGFFVLSDNGQQSYTRSGIFSINNEGFVVGNSGARLQGLVADSSGQFTGQVTDLQISTQDVAPKSTTQVNQSLNMDAADEILSQSTSTIDSSGPGVGAVQLGADNGYTAGTLQVNGTDHNIPSVDSLSAAQIAAELNDLGGVSATAQTQASLVVDTGYPVGNNELFINGQPYIGADINELAADINAGSGLTAVVNGAAIDITVSTGLDLSFDLTAPASAGTQLTITTPAGAQALDGSVPAQQIGTVGGSIEIIIDRQITLSNAATTNVFGPLAATPNPASVTFSPDNPESYNSLTSFSVFDTEGIQHSVTQYFVREPNVPGEEGTSWTTYVQIDGRDVGGTDPSNPIQASFILKFNPNGSYDETHSEPVVISNWVPTDKAGIPNGARGPQNPPVVPIPEPAESSNFIIDVSAATAYGGAFAVSSLEQNGFAKGSLSGVDVSEDGTIFARYSNGETQALGLVQLAHFRNPQGLTSLGESLWSDSIASGQAIIGNPGTGQLGAIQAGALEDSNVDLTEQLVNLILAQRNFQANAKTIETADSVTQTIINIR